jgi:predicted ATP-dependent endonuclease of OLD family
MLTIEKVRIKNFRLFKESEFRLLPTTIIVGKNNSGKSGLLKAINCFFNPEDEMEALKGGHHNHSGNSQISIEIVFKADAKFNKLDSYKRNDRIEVRFTYSKKEDCAVYKIKSGKTWVRLRKSSLRSIHENISFVLIPAYRSEREIQSASKSALKRLLAVNYERNHLKKDFSRIQSKYLEKNANIPHEINRALDLGSEGKVALGWVGDFDPRKQFSQAARLVFSENDNEFPPEHTGSGVQSQILIFLYFLIANKRKSHCVIGVEEPEINLHPQAQRALLASFQALSQKKKGISFVITTHSPTVIDTVPHDNIVRVVKRLNSGRNHADLKQLPENFWTDNGIDKDKKDKFFRYKNSEIFYADHIIVCEGQADAEVIRCLAEKEKIDLLASGVSLLTLDGVRNLNYPFSLIKALDLNHLVVVDKDFFFDYSNGKLSQSRNARFFPLYSSEFRSNCDFILKHFSTVSTEIEALKNFLFANHSRANQMLVKKGIICFKWNLETDLVNGGVARTELLKTFFKGKVPAGDAYKLLLDDRHNAIGEPDRLVRVVSKLDIGNLPNSYKLIKRALRAMVA